MDTLYLSTGGIKGYSILGVIKLLEKKDILKNFKTIIGNSIGSVIGFLIILGYSSKSIYKLLLKNLEEVLFKKQINEENLILNLINHYGINNGKSYKKVLEFLLREKKYKINISFKELYEKNNINFIVIASDIKNIELFYFSKNTTPNYPVINSIMASTCLPLIFKPILYNNRILIDGGYFNNIKIKYITKKTLVVDIKSDSNYLDINDSMNLLEYSKLLINSLLKSVQNNTNYNSKNIIKLYFNIPGISLNINNDIRQDLYLYGILESFFYFKNKYLLKKYFIVMKNRYLLKKYFSVMKNRYLLKKYFIVMKNRYLLKKYFIAMK
jgi:predicted acylesterase/phospholipase RssA